MDRHVIQFEYIADTKGSEKNIASLTRQLYSLNQQITATGGSLGKNLANNLNTDFTRQLKSMQGFTTQVVALETQGMRLGKTIEANNLSMSKQNSLLRDYRAGAVGARGAITELAKEQVRMSKSVVTMFDDGTGRKMARVTTPSGLDMSKQANVTKVANQEMQIYNRLLQQNAQEIVNWGKNTQWAGRQIMVGMTIPIVMFGQAAKETFIEVDQQLTRLAKVYGATLSGTNKGATDAIKKETSQLASELASSWGVAAKDTAGIAADIAATGKEGKVLIDSTREAMRLSVLGEVDRQEAMKATLAMQSAFGMSTTELTESINFLNAVENQTSTSLSDLIEAIPRTGPVVRAFGGDVKDLAAMLTAMREGGVDAAEGANAIKSGLASLVNPTKQAAEQARDFGIDLVGIVEKNKGQLMPTILEFRDALATLPSFERGQLIETIFGKYQLGRLTALFDNIGRVGSQTEKVFELAGASAEQLANVAESELTTLVESSSMKWQRAVESFKVALLPIGQVVTTAFTFVANAAANMLEAFNELPSPVKRLFELLVGFGALVGPLLMIGGIFGNFLGNMMKGYAFLKGRKGGLFSMITQDSVAAASAANALTEAQYSEAAALDTVNAKIQAQIELLQALAGASNSASALRTMAEDRGMVPPSMEPGSRGYGANQGPNKGTVIGLFEQAGTGSLQAIKEGMEASKLSHNQAWAAHLDKITPDVARFADEAAVMASDALANGISNFDAAGFRSELKARADRVFGKNSQMAKHYTDIISGGLSHMLDQAPVSGVKTDWIREGAVPRKNAHDFASAALAAHTAAGGRGFEPGAYQFGHGAIYKGNSLDPRSEQGRGLYAEDKTSPVQIWQDQKENNLLKDRPRPPESSGRGLRDTGGSSFTAWFLAESMASSGIGKDMLGSGPVSKVGKLIDDYLSTSLVGADASRRAQQVFQDVSSMDDATSAPLGDSRQSSERMDRLRAEKKLAKREINEQVADQAARAKAYEESDIVKKGLFGVERQYVKEGMTGEQKWAAREKGFSDAIKKTSGELLAAEGELQALASKPLFTKSPEARISKGITAALEGLKTGTTSSMKDATRIRALGDPTLTGDTGQTVKTLVQRGETEKLRQLRDGIVSQQKKAGVDTTAFAESFDKLIGEVDSSLQKRSGELKKAQAKVQKAAKRRVSAEAALVASQAAGDQEGVVAAKRRFNSAKRQQRAASRQLKEIENRTAKARAQAETDAAFANSPSQRGRRARSALGRGVSKVGVAATAAMGVSMFTDNKNVQRFSMILLGFSMIVPLLSGAGKLLMSAATRLNGSAFVSMFRPGGGAGKAMGAFGAAKGVGGKASVLMKGIGKSVGMISGFLGPMGWAALAIGGLATILWKIHDTQKKQQERERRAGSLSLDLLGIPTIDYSSRAASAPTASPAALSATQALKEELGENETYKQMVTDAKQSGNALSYLTQRYVGMSRAIALNTELTDKERVAMELRAKSIISLAMAESGATEDAYELAQALESAGKQAEAGNRGWTWIDPTEAKRAEALGKKINEINESTEEGSKGFSALGEPSTKSESTYNPFTGETSPLGASGELSEIQDKIRRIIGDWGAVGTTMADSFKIGDTKQALSTVLGQVLELKQVADPVGNSFDDWKKGIEASSPAMYNAIKDADSYDEAIRTIVADMGLIPAEVRTVWSITTQKQFIDDLIEFEAGVDTVAKKFQAQIDSGPVADNTENIEASYDKKVEAAQAAQEAAEEAQEAEKKAVEKQIKAKEKEQEAIEKTIDKINEEADAKREALEEAKDAADFMRDMRQADIDYYDALARGDYAQAARVQNDRQGMVEDQSYDQTLDAIDDEEERAVKAQQSKIDAIQAEIDKTQEALDKKQEMWDAENKQNQKAIEALNKNRDSAIAAEQKKVAAAEAARAAKVKASEDAKNKMIADLNAEAAAGKLSMEDIVKYAGTAAAVLGEQLGWSPAQVTKFKNDMVGTLTAAYSGFLNSIGIVDLAKGGDLGMDGKPRKPGERPLPPQLVHTGGEIKPDATSGKGAIKDDETVRVLQSGEFVVQRKAVNKYGTDVFEDINSMKMHTGGYVSPGAFKKPDKKQSIGTGPFAKPAMFQGGGVARNAAMSRIVQEANALFPKLLAKSPLAGQAPAGPGGAGGSTSAAPASYDTGEKTFGNPLTRPYRLTSGFGWRIHPTTGLRSFHQGQDMAKEAGSPIYASERGKIVQQQVNDGIAGNAFRLDHGSGWQTRYLHMSKFVAKLGDLVTKGQIIGRVGTTGRSTGNHLHFETKKDGKLLDPRSVVSLREGGEIKLDNVPANLHRKETVLTAPLSAELKEGISRLNSTPSFAGESGGDTVSMGDRHYNIVVNAAPGMSEEAVANRVFAKIERKESRMGYK
jgi:TP901 family phage tail tape measure protein